MGAKLKPRLQKGLTGAAALAAMLMPQTERAWAEEEVALPQINVTDTRLTGTGARARQGSGAPSVPGPASGASQADELNTTYLPDNGGGVTGASTTVITSRDIERSPEQNLQAILSREPGIQVTNSFGGVNGARSQVDMRGFGATANSNTLFLINGRRVQDLDMVGVDLASIPRDSIERIEITRGNSGAVLYGDGAVGGVINIVTKNGVGQKPTARIEGAFGSFNQQELNASAAGSSGGWSASAFGTMMGSDGYRQNNQYKQQSAVGDLRYNYGQGSFYLNISGDNQDIGLPGGRRYSPQENIYWLVTERRGAATPFDWAAKQGQNATIGVAHMLAPGYELIIDGGVRKKEEQGQYFNVTFGTYVPTLGERAAVDTKLTTSSFTPRLKINSNWWGLPTTGMLGFDYIVADYDSARPQALGITAPIHQYDLKQSSQAFYWLQNFKLPTNTEISGGFRTQRTSIQANDVFDPMARGAIPVSCFPGFGCFGDLAGTPLDQSQTNHAYHAGIEQKLSPNFAVFGRIAQSFRVPNVDERVGMVPTLNAEPTTFDLRTQKSHDWEAGVKFGNSWLQAQWSYYEMKLTDEIMFQYDLSGMGKNINLDPTRRYGNETIVTMKLSDQFRIKGGLANTRAVFREGPFAGNDVPLVSHWTGNIGVSWDVWKNMTLDVVNRYFSPKRMDNDQLNNQPMIPSYNLVDVRLGGTVEQFFWSVAVLNLFNVQYFDYSIASPYPWGPGSLSGTYSAYPMPGRSYMLKAGLKW
jgi:iron complex outermembrane receptor protein